MRTSHIITALMTTFLAVSCQEGVPSALNASEFDKHWTVESESPDYSITFKDDYCEIVAPKGLTLWRNEKMSGNVTIEYDACVVVEDEKDRLSDLNCFWMASDPRADDIWKNMEKRGGIFANCASLQLYYVGYGGNWNSTTRFRRYNGESAPPIIQEYTDEAHLLQANKWYHIVLKHINGNTSYTIEGNEIFEWTDPEPLREGWFGFRTTLSRTRIKNFYYNTNQK